LLGVDIGGTFTDFALLETGTGTLATGKCLTTPDDPSRGFLEGLRELCARTGLKCEALERLSHATTLVTNAIIERKGCRTGLILTAGFGDVLLMGRESRYDHYDFKFERPEPLVPRHLTREVKERLSWDGRVLEPLDADSVREALRTLAAAGVDAIAVCLLHAYRNPVHEQAVKALAAGEFPELDCTISSDVAPEIREYERASTTVCNAYVRPLVRDYLAVLDRQLSTMGLRRPLQVMLSNGGITSAEVASTVPIQIIESGPAAGALAAAYFARTVGVERALAFDMGGTTAKLCYVDHGQPAHANWFEAARARRFKRGSGLPLLIPVVELMEIGAGGGSIAEVDHLGLLKVGPHSAGASPGPAAYALGGVRPTVTDADVVLGYIDPERFLGGDMALDASAAARAIAEHVGGPLGLDTIGAAWGIFSIVNETMVAAARRYTAERAIDVRDCTLITFGGAAPLHAWQVARILDVRDILYPMGAGVTSAVGLCIATPVVNISRTCTGSLEQLDFASMADMLEDMETRARAMLISAGATENEIAFQRSVDVRYKGQGYEIEVPISGIGLRGSDAASVRAEVAKRFSQQYERAYGRVLGRADLEAITWRVRAEAGQEAKAASAAVRPASADAASGRRRRIYFGPRVGFEDAPVYDRYSMASGSIGVGPALLQERETTVVVPPHAQWRVDEHMNLRVRLPDDGNSTQAADANA
jgi:N-methylhydantoinase A